MISGLANLFSQTSVTDGGPRSPTESNGSSSDTQTGESSSASERETAQQLLALAQAALTNADDDSAVRLVEQSLASGCVLPAAKELQEHLHNFGPGSSAHFAVKRTLSASDDCGVLGLQQPVSPTRLKKAYKRLCMELHPDRCRARGAEEAFKRLQEAYAALDPTGARSSTARKAAATARRRHEEDAQRRKDRTFTSRGVDPRYGAPAPRGRRHLEPEPAVRANGKPKAARKAALPTSSAPARRADGPSPTRRMGPLEA